MDIITLQFEEPLIIHIANSEVRLVAFKTQEPGNVKFGVDAPLSVQVHREEIFEAIKKKERFNTTE